jgi:hypothetical protein
VRINAPPPPVFTVPDAPSIGPVDATRTIAPVDGGNRGAGDLARMYERLPPEPPGTPWQGLVERRAQEVMRRGEERRQRQLPVMIDTRTGRERRQAARRAADAARRRAIDIKA